MSEVLLVKRLLVQASVSVLAGMLMSSASTAEDDAAPVGSDENEVVVEVIDPMPVEEPVGVTGEEVDVELGDPLCADCSTGGPDVAIDPMEMVGEEVADGGTEDGTTPEVSIDPMEMEGVVVDVPVEVMQNEVTMTGGPDVQRDAVKPEPRGDHGTVARATGSGQNPAWLKNLFKIK
jgi:hypothetical protein